MGRPTTLVGAQIPDDPAPKRRRRAVIATSLAAVLLLLAGFTFGKAQGTVRSETWMTARDLRRALDEIESGSFGRDVLTQSYGISALTVKRLRELASRNDDIGEFAKIYLNNLKKLMEGK